MCGINHAVLVASSSPKFLLQIQFRLSDFRETVDGNLTEIENIIQIVHIESNCFYLCLYSPFMDKQFLL